MKKIIIAANYLPIEVQKVNGLYQVELKSDIENAGRVSWKVYCEGNEPVNAGNFQQTGLKNRLCYSTL